MAVKIKRDGLNKHYKGNRTNWIWKTGNKEESNIALNVHDKMDRNRTDRKESQFREGEKLSTRYLEVITGTCK